MSHGKSVVIFYKKKKCELPIFFEGNVTWIDLCRMGKIWIDENKWIGHGEERECCVWKILCMPSKLDQRM